MDGVSNVAGILGVVSILVQLMNGINNLHEFMSSIKDAPRDIAAICSSLKVVSSVLESIRTEMTTSSSEVLCLALNDCLSILSQLESIAEELSPGFNSDRSVVRGWTALRSLKKKEKIKSFKATLQSAQITLIVAQQESTRRLQVAHYNDNQRSSKVVNRANLEIMSKLHASQDALVNMQLRSGFEICQAMERLNSSMSHQRESFEVAKEALLEQRTENSLIISKSETESRMIVGTQPHGTSEVVRNSPQIRICMDSCMWTRRTAFGNIFYKSKRFRSSSNYSEGTDPKVSCKEEDEFTSSLRLAPPWWLQKCGLLYDLYAKNLLSSQMGWKFGLQLFNIIPDNAPVFHCCKTGNLLGLQKILSERSASVRDTDSQGRTPLHFAAAECYPQMCQFLIQAGADVSIEATWAGTPFMLASFPYASVTTTTEHRPTCDQVDTLRVIANGGQDILEAIEDGALIYTFSADSQSRSRLVKSGKAQSTSAWLLQQCLLSARDIGHSFEPRWWVRILTEALINEAEQELITEVLQYCDPVMVQFAVCMWIKIMSHRLRVHRSIKASSTNLRQILRKIPDLHFVYEHDFLMNPIALGPLTPTSLALRRSYTFAFFRSLLKEASIDIEEFVRIESDIIGSGWQENTLRATFLDDYPMVELGDRELAYCKHCECHMDVMGWHETLWEQRLERRKEMKDPNGPFSEKELRQQNEWRRYVHEFVENHICYKCQERTRVQNDTEHEDGFSPYLLHL